MVLSQRPNQTLAFRVTDESQVGQVRRMALKLAERAGFDDTAQGNLAIVANEATRNIVRHAGGGTMLLNVQDLGWAKTVDVIALDRGPGITDPKAALTDGFSTFGTAGTGLGAMRRLSAEFDLWSEPGRGTALIARTLPTRPGHTPLSGGCLEIGGLSVAMPGMAECGDGWACRVHRERTAILICDGLGHGREAAKATDLALDYFFSHDLPPGEMVQSMHPLLRRSRGAAVSVVETEARRERILYAGIGNISGTLIQKRQRSGLLGQHGIVGGNVRTVQTQQYDWPPGAALVLCSDGLSSGWNLEYPFLRQHHPLLVAGLLYRDFRRPKDDTTAVVVRRRRVFQEPEPGD